MKKSIRTRLKLTKNGKVLRRAMGLCHFRAKRSGTQSGRKKGLRSINFGKKVSKLT